MNTDIENLYQAIGQEALDSAGPSLAGRLLVYAEVEDGSISADMFFAQGQGRPLRFRFCSRQLQELLMALWEKWRAVPGQSKWRVLSYVIDDGDFHIDLQYPDQIDEDEDVSDRRPRALAKYFGDAPVDYSSP